MKKHDNNLKGVLFKNTRKNKPNQPDEWGSVEIDGQEYRLAVWGWKKSANGNKYKALRLTPADAENYEAPKDAGDVPAGVEGQ